VFTYLAAKVFWNNAILAEGADIQKLIDGLAVLAESSRAVLHDTSLGGASEPSKKKSFCN
jgi:hypothetical protein